MPNSHPPHTLPRSMWALLALLTLGWGMNWPMMKLAVTDIPVWTFRVACTLAGAAGLFLIAKFAGLPAKVPRGQWPRLCLIAFFNVTMWNILIAYGLTLLPSGRSAILAYSMPLWVVLLSALFLRERLTARRILGLALGMAGMGLLIGDAFTSVQTSPVGAALVIAAAMSWALGTVLMRCFPVALGTTALTAWQLLVGGLPIVLGALILEWGTWRPVSLGAALGLTYNVLVVSIFCYWAWFRIAGSAPAGVAALSTLMIPVVGVFSSMVILGEMPHWRDYTALLLVIAALATVLVPRRPPFEQS
jgi:drug/metabolite transporter (DMT)-like permease